MGLIVDTSVFISLERAGKPADFTPWQSFEPFAISAITVSELRVGVLRAESSERRLRREAFVDAMIKHMVVHAFDEATALVHAEMTVQLLNVGKPIGDHDAMIAATALVRSYALLTSNVREFGHVQGLHVVPFKV